MASWTFSNFFLCPETCSVFRGVQEYSNSELKSGGFVFDPVWQLLSQTPMIPANARVWPFGVAGVRAPLTLLTSRRITGALLLLWTTEVFQGMCWNFQGFTRSISAFRNNPKKMLSVLFNQQ